MILITGASGFLGKHLVQYLSGNSRKIRALYHRHPPSGDFKNLPGVEWVCCDLLDVFAVEAALNGISEVYHCAAIVSFDPRKRDEMLHFNPESTANLVNQVLLQGIRKMVYVSSVAAIGRSGELKKEITEEEEWGESRYNSAYGISKYMAEMEVWRGIGEGLNAVIVNPGIILGTGSPNDLSARLMSVVYREFPFYSRGVNAWVDVKDVVRALAMLMEADVKEERFILSGGSFAYKEIFTLMAHALKKRPPRYYVHPFITGIGWRLGALRSAVLGKSSIITKETVRNSNAICYYNNNKLQEAFPEFSYTPVKQTIESMAQSFLEGNKALAFAQKA